MVRGANNYNKAISTILGEVWVIIGTHKRDLQSFSGWSRIRKFIMPHVGPMEISVLLIYFTDNYGIFYAPNAV